MHIPYLFPQIAHARGPHLKAETQLSQIFNSIPFFPWIVWSQECIEPEGLCATGWPIHQLSLRLAVHKPIRKNCQGPQPASRVWRPWSLAWAERPREGCSHRFGVNTRSAGPTVNFVQKSVSNHLLLFPGSFRMPSAGSPVLNMVGGGGLYLYNVFSMSEHQQGGSLEALKISLSSLVLLA